MDGSPLASSKRVIVFHLTDVLNSGAVFKSTRRTDMTNWGELPYLAAAGEAKIALRKAVRGEILSYNELMPEYMRLAEAEQRLRAGTLSDRIRFPVK